MATFKWVRGVAINVLQISITAIYIFGQFKIRVEIIAFYEKRGKMCIFEHLLSL